MKDQLAFVRGALATKDIVPILTHLHFYEGRVQAGDGRMAIDAPCPGVDATAPGERMIYAIDACDGKPTLKITEGGRLAVSSAKTKFRAVLPLLPQADYPRGAPDTVRISKGKLDDLIKVLSRIRPFIAEDASRPWACGALVRGGFVCATNNVVLVRSPVKVKGEIDMNIPAFALDQLLRIGEAPDWMAAGDNSVTFHYKGGAWLKAQLFEAKWPDVDKILSDNVGQPGTVPDGLTEAIAKVEPFCDPKFAVIHLGPEGVSTPEGDTMATAACKGLAEGKYRLETLQRVLELAEKIDLSRWPKPGYFEGEGGLVGVFMGLA